MTGTTKVIGLGIAIWLALRGKKPAPPPATPKPKLPPVVTPPSCREPVGGARWKICDVAGTIDERNYQALYHKSTKRLVAIIDTTTYDDTGETAVVVAVPEAGGILWEAGYQTESFPMSYGG
jgi:hypothetical protein